MIKKLLFFILTLTLPIKLSVVFADEITSFNFMDKGNNSFIIGANSSISGDLSIVVEDITQTKPYINLLVATTGYPDFVVTENNYFANTVIKKLYSSGSTNIDGYTADLYVVQLSTRGTNWNCSTSGLNCSVSTNLRLNNSYPYNSIYQLQSIALTDTVLTDDYLSNMQISQNNQIIEQGNLTNDKLDNLDDSIQSGNQAIQDSITESNKETQDVIKDQFNDCKQSLNLLNIPNSTRVSNGVTTIINNNRININGTLTNSYGSLTYDFSFNISAGTYVFSVNKKVPINIDMYIDGKRATTLMSNTLYSVFTVNNDTSITGFAFTGVNGQSYNISDLIFQVEVGSTPTKVIPYGEEDCSNRIDETNDKLDDLNNSITNDNVSGIQESFSQFEDFLDDNSTITQLITLPVTLYSSILQGVSSSCTPFNLGTLYGESLILPCINIGNYLGSSLWGMIDLIISGFAIYSISKKLIKVFNNFSSMKEGDVIDD